MSTQTIKLVVIGDGAVGKVKKKFKQFFSNKFSFKKIIQDLPSYQLCKERVSQRLYSNCKENKILLFSKEKWIHFNFSTKKVFDNYVVNLTAGEQNIELGLWDTAGQEEYVKKKKIDFQKF